MALNTASLKSMLSSYLEAFSHRRDVSTATVNRQAAVIKNVAGILEQVEAKEESIAQSTVLSAAGKSAALGELATANIPKLVFLPRQVEELQSDITNTRQRLFTVPPPDAAGSDPLLRYFFGLEIRQDYKSLSPNERDAQFLLATQSGHDAVAWAIQSAPISLIRPDVMRVALEERASKLNPDTVNRVRENEILLESLASLQSAVVTWLRGLGGDQKKISDQLGGPEPAPSPIEATLQKLQHV